MRHCKTCGIEVKEGYKNCFYCHTRQGKENNPVRRAFWNMMDVDPFAA